MYHSDIPTPVTWRPLTPASETRWHAAARVAVEGTIRGLALVVVATPSLRRGHGRPG